MIVIASQEEKELLKRLREISPTDHNSTGVLSAEVVTLKKQIADLEIDKSKKLEDFDKRERELLHMIGLERKRQEFEIDQAKRETTVKVREENLAADKARFEGQMEFQQERFEKEVTYLKEMMKDILKRLPDVNVEINKRGR